MNFTPWVPTTMLAYNEPPFVKEPEPLPVPGPLTVARMLYCPECGHNSRRSEIHHLQYVGGWPEGPMHLIGEYRCCFGECHCQRKLTRVVVSIEDRAKCLQQWLYEPQKETA